MDVFLFIPLPPKPAKGQSGKGSAPAGAPVPAAMQTDTNGTAPFRYRGPSFWTPCSSPFVEIWSEPPVLVPGRLPHIRT